VWGDVPKKTQALSRGKGPRSVGSLDVVLEEKVLPKKPNLGGPANEREVERMGGDIQQIKSSRRAKYTLGGGKPEKLDSGRETTRKKKEIGTVDWFKAGKSR